MSSKTVSKSDSGRQQLSQIVLLPARLKKLRVILNTIGGCGFMLWFTLCGLVWLLRDFKPGGSVGGLSVWQGWFSVLAPLITFGYYTWVAGLDWNKWMLLGGIVLHLLLIISITLLSFFTDGGFVVAPLLLIGPVCWIIYVAEINKLSQNFQETHGEN